MENEEEEKEISSDEVNPDALEAALGDEVDMFDDEDEAALTVLRPEDEYDVDIAFQANDEGYW